jgi:chromosome segregation ATPase
MSTAILDRVESLATENESKRRTKWTDLVYAFVDDKLNDPAEIAAIFQEQGKCRTDLERDGKLLREYRTLQLRLKEVPKLQAQYNELMEQLHVAIDAREAAEKALSDAQEKCRQLDNRTSLLSQSIYISRQAAAEMRDSKFHVINSAVSADPEADSLREELARRENRILELQQLIERKEGVYTALAQEATELEVAKMPPTEKEDKSLRINLSMRATREQIGRLQVEVQELQQELAARRGKGRPPTFGMSNA